MRALDLPIVRFLLLGAGLFLLERTLAPATHEAAGVIEPSDEEILFREALRLGLDRKDPVVRRRLIANLRFAGADPDAGDQALLREADALGMRRTDLVVRRRLVQVMQQRLEASARSRLPGERELADHLVVESERFDRPASWRFAHVLVSAERHPGDLRRVAERVRESLIRAGAGPEAARARSDPFLLGSHYGPASEKEIAAAFGPELARAVAALEPGRWSEPVGSVFGLHLVWVEERNPAKRATLAEAGDQARLGLLSDRERQALDDGIAALRSRHGIAEVRP